MTDPYEVHPFAMIPAERRMSEVLRSHLSEVDGPARILNAGAGSSTKFEDELAGAGIRFEADRVDIDECQVERDYVGECWTASVEDMNPIPSERYDAVFANYLLEHVQGLQGAADEVYRVLKPGGLFVTTIPNTRAPEFIVSRHTPLAFHEWVRGGKAWETEYAYQSLAELAQIFLRAGFAGQELARSSCIDIYTDRFPLVKHLGRAYDCVVTRCHWTFVMGQACLVLRKPRVQAGSTTATPA